MVKNFKKIYFILIAIIITIIAAEGFSKLFVKFGILNKGLPSWVTLRAHSDFGNWHPKNITLTIEKKNCWVSTISYDSDGSRKIFNGGTKINKEFKSIALLGDSMLENLEVNDGSDLGSLIQKRLKSYRVFNFGVRGTGLGDQTEIYKKLIKPLKVDYVFLFLTENDIYNNVYGLTTVHHKRFDYIDDKVIEIPKDENFLNNYNSKKKIFFRDGLLFLKKLDLYKVYLKYYYHFKTKKNLQKNNSQKDRIEIIEKFNLSEKKIKIYNKIKKDFINALDPQTQLFVFLNARPHIFDPTKDEDTLDEYMVTNFYKDVWKDVPNFYDPYNFAKEKLVEKGKFSFPYLSWDCDHHYSYEGARIYSDFVSKSFLKTIN